MKHILPCCVNMGDCISLSAENHKKKDSAAPAKSFCVSLCNCSPFVYFVYTKVLQAENNNIIPVIKTNGNKFFISYSSLYFDLFLFFESLPLKNDR